MVSYFTALADTVNIEKTIHGYVLRASHCILLNMFVNWIDEELKKTDDALFLMQAMLP